MKICSKCGGEALPKFAWCLLCRKTYDAQRYQEKRELRQAQIEAQQDRVRQWMDDVKSYTPCTDCGLNWPPFVMQWDHLPGTIKVGNVSDMAMRGCKGLAMEEMEKCELVCSNCHAIRTHSRKQDMV